MPWLQAQRGHQPLIHFPHLDEDSVLRPAPLLAQDDGRDAERPQGQRFQHEPQHRGRGARGLCLPPRGRSPAHLRRVADNVTQALGSRPSAA